MHGDTVTATIVSRANDTTAKPAPGSMWSNRTADGRCFKNYGTTAVTVQLGVVGLLRWTWRRWRAGLPRPPRGGYAAFAAQWHRPDAARQALSTLASASSTATTSCADTTTTTTTTTATTAATATRTAARRTRPLGTSDCAFWLGHATSLLCLRHAINVLVDPVFSRRASPLSFAGPLRRVPPALTLDELPRIDVVAISHNHYDHLDAASITRLHARFPAAVFVVPLGVDRYLRRWGIAASCIAAMDWWEERALCGGGVVVACTPAQHWSLRVPGDRNTTLWCGWCIGWRRDGQPLHALAQDDAATCVAPTSPRDVMDKSNGNNNNSSSIGSNNNNNKNNNNNLANEKGNVDAVVRSRPARSRSCAAVDDDDVDGDDGDDDVDSEDVVRSFYFAGDTGFSRDMFTAIRARYRAITLAALPIGAYEPRWALAPQHMSPSDAVEAFALLQPRRAYGVHWGTFELGDDALDDPPRALAAAAQQRGITTFDTIAMGECLTF